jgi:acyl-CoA thioesterase YciA
MAKTATLPDKEPVLRVVPMPADVNQHGDIFGGWIMAQVDIAGGVMAARHARGRVATVAVNSFTFKQPVFIGDLVTFYAEVTRVGKTSITVDVEVYAQRTPRDLIRSASPRVLTYVAVGDDRRPREIAKPRKHAVLRGPTTNAGRRCIVDAAVRPATHEDEGR